MAVRLEPREGRMDEDDEERKHGAAGNPGAQGGSEAPGIADLDGDEGDRQVPEKLGELAEAARGHDVGVDRRHQAVRHAPLRVGDCDGPRDDDGEDEVRQPTESGRRQPDAAADFAIGQGEAPREKHRRPRQRQRHHAEEDEGEEKSPGGIGLGKVPDVTGFHGGGDC